MTPTSSPRPRHAPARGRRALAALAALALGLAAPTARAGDGTGGPTRDGAVPGAIERLRSPSYEEREAAVADLIAMGEEGREAVLGAFATGEPEVRSVLVPVLAADGSPAAVEALLAALGEPLDAGTTWSIQLALVGHGDRVRAAVAPRREKGGEIPSAVEDLLALLRRARTEELFLSRKSRTGGTGSYPGQYEVLREDREMALEVCLAVVLDKCLKVPGIFPMGSYRWLRRPGWSVDRFELQHMAVNALGELATPNDARVIQGLERLFEELDPIVVDKGRWRGVAEASLQDAVMATLARLAPDPWRIAAEERAKGLSSDLSDPTTLDDGAALYLRLGNYRKAVQCYRLLAGRRGEGALAHYNLACAYARWAVEAEEPERARERKDWALDAIEATREAGYADWAWMEEDRDLDPIRGEPRFAAVLAAMKAQFRPRPPSPPTPPLPDPSPGPPAMDR